MKKKLTALILALLVILSLCACGSSAAVSQDTEDYGETAETYAYDDGAIAGEYYDGEAAPMEDAAAAEVYEDADYAAGDSTSDSNASSVYGSSNVKLIRTANLSFESRDFDASCSGIEELTVSLDGYMESSNVYTGSSYETRSASYTARIPSENYDAFLSQLSGVSNCQLVSKYETSEDVGQQYAEVETHLEMLNTKLERLQALMAEATKMEDILTLEDAISETEYDISWYSEQKNSYDDLIGFSTFYISVEEVYDYTPVEEPNPTFSQRISDALSSCWTGFTDGLQDLAVWFVGNLIGIVIFLAVVTAVILVIRRLVKKSRKAAAPQAPPQMSRGSMPEQPRTADPQAGIDPHDPRS